MFTSLLYAQTADVAQKAQPGGGFMQMAPLIFIFIVFYFLLIRPQQKKAKEHQKMLDEIQKGDQILTTGGIYGTVTAIKGNIFEVKIADEVKVRLSKTAVAGVVKPESTADIQTAEVVK